MSVSFDEIAKSQLLLAQAFEALAITVNQSRFLLNQIMSNSGTDGLNIFNPQFYSLGGGRQVAVNIWHPITTTLMITYGTVLKFGGTINVAPGGGNTRTFRVVKNNLTAVVNDITWANAELGYKEVLLSIPFVPGDELGIITFAAGAALDASPQFTTFLRLESPP